jgi:hypothetical protein
MDRNELTISNDDLAEIFGGAIETPAAENLTNIKEHPPAAEPPKPKEPPKDAAKPKILTSKLDELFSLPQQAPAKPAAGRAGNYAAEAEKTVDDLIKRAEEIEKQIKKEEVKDLSFEDFLEDRVIIEIINEFNDIRAALQSELFGKIDAKAVENMMLRTLEKTSNNFILLKNTNWDSDGKLRMNGSIDTERFIRNITAYKTRIQELGREIEESLKALLYMRLKAVKLGFGKEKYETIKNGLIKRLNTAEGGYSRSTAKFVKQNIVDKAIKKGDE